MPGKIDVFNRSTMFSVDCPSAARMSATACLTGVLDRSTNYRH
ncbi:hypothetical protein [Mesorhizobium sp.]|nr:hypothetical protein [Mesorhizobium sp.]